MGKRDHHSQPLAAASPPRMNAAGARNALSASPSSANVSAQASEHKMLQSYIYDYLLKMGLNESAKTFMSEAEVSTKDDASRTRTSKPEADLDSPELGNMSALDSVSALMDAKRNRKPQGPTEDESKTKAADDKSCDLPSAIIPIDVPGGFLYEWWIVFWDMYNARNSRNGSQAASQLIAHSQRLRQQQEHQRSLSIGGMGPQHPGMAAQQGHMINPAANAAAYNPALRSAMPNGMMQMHPGIDMNNPDLNNEKVPLSPPGVVVNLLHRPGSFWLVKLLRTMPSTARRECSSRNNPSPTLSQYSTTQQLQTLAKNNPMYAAHQQQQLQAQREQSEQNGAFNDPSAQRPNSPAMSGREPSPPKRQRLSPDGAFATIQQAGRPQMVSAGPQLGPSHMPQGMTPNEYQQQQIAAMQQQTANGPQKQNMQQYAQALTRQQQNAMGNVKQALGGQIPGATPSMHNPNLTKGQQGQQSSMGEYYNPMRPTTQASLQDYQMQLQILAQQNQKRIQMARHEDDGAPRGPGTAESNPSFSAMSPQNTRRQQSPQPTAADMARRNTSTPKLSHPPNPNSPADPQAQMRNSSPNMAAVYNGQIPQDPQQQMMLYNQLKSMSDMNGVTLGPGGQMLRPQMGGAAGHPAFMNNPAVQMSMMSNGPDMNMMRARPGYWQSQQPQQMMAAMTPHMRMAMQQQAAAQQHHAAQQMPPPGSHPIHPMNGNNRGQPQSPSVSNVQVNAVKAQQAAQALKKRDKDSKKKTTKKTAATPNNEVSEHDADDTMPTPATPTTPKHPKSFSNTSAPPSNQTTQPPEPPSTFSTSMDQPEGDNFLTFNFADGADTGMGDFDFDSFLNTDNDPNMGNFDASSFFNAGDGLEAES
ncbi:Adhesion defective protein 2 [Neolecta irregularis DAH-3]|uniref:Adhesion defective protein 2 n=1 Tax=Neolecta irregularis (strain DAH-3) TaxID=1198029 RepID=A0A1U7LMS8_NEOID|nr:Adhesion defective protein 2 [Neolecta irregularis DAH-3]|eukprot:OLL23949.1 Adhesion defective protein 2 [Neolecta irregularis DAH-3]